HGHARARGRMAHEVNRRLAVVARPEPQELVRDAVRHDANKRTPGALRLATTLSAAPWAIARMESALLCKRLGGAAEGGRRKCLPRFAAAGSTISNSRPSAETS